MTSTTIEAPARTKRLDLFVWWADSLPAECGLAVTDLQPLIAQVAGHPVDPAVIEDLACAFALPTTTTGQQDERRERIEQLVERLDAVELCAADGCQQILTGTLPPIDCPHSGDGSYCSWECASQHHADHAGGRACYALGDLS